MPDQLSWDWGYCLEIAPELARAAWISLQAAVLGMLLALALGLAGELLRRTPGPLSWAARWVMEAVRTTPLLVQLFAWFYLLPSTGVQISALTTGVVALGVHYAPFVAEVYRAGIEGVPESQWDAARALNFKPAQIWCHVVLPQALPPVIPALGNYFIALFKETPLLAAITVMELLQTAKIIGAESFRYLEPLTLVGAFFLLCSLAASRAVRCMEARLARPS